MGMFDTFWGEYKCPSCGHDVQFEEQTKRYECILEDFYLGDYVDRGNRNYLYDFEHMCPDCHTVNDVYIAIRRGQYVGVYVGEESSERMIFVLNGGQSIQLQRTTTSLLCRAVAGW